MTIITDSHLVRRDTLTHRVFCVATVLRRDVDKQHLSVQSRERLKAASH